ncbi:HEAT repeat domain-containing protein [Cognaticolwellia mytili]|uniref:HEAT repeat domain-containing protein n=1 Tax=Cognaticolwellia mytili TaxID=1888913 RepID=UPI000A173FAE|nr:HEAT repeat domain-containing protein [Cognaticolwellia mytili]
MIFSKFLKKKWQHKDSVVRVEAITSSLSIDEPEQLEIISQLAMHDDNENVRRAALIKLGSFQTWLTQSQENSMPKVKQYAQKKVEAILTDQDDVKVSEQEKLNYIAGYNHYALFENWLKQTEQANLIIALFEKIATKPSAIEKTTTANLKPQLLINLFNQKQSVEVQQYIVNKVHDLDTLEKLKKKAVNNEISSQIEGKISALKFALEQPIILSKKVNLVLAKLQALKDQRDYAVYLDKRKSLESEWQALTEDFSCLEMTVSEEFTNKQQTIATNLSKIFAVKAEQFAQAELGRRLEEDKQQCRIHFDKTLAIVDQTLSTSIFENEEVDEQQYQTVFDKLTSEIIASPLIQSEQNDFIAKICQQQQKLQRLPEIAKSVSEATQLISKVSQLALPTNVEEMNERLPTYQEWLKNWKDAEKQSAGTLPDSIKNASKEIQNNWRQALKPLQQTQKQEFSATQKKINDVKRLIAGGKYNAAFGVFKKAKHLFASLSEQQQLRLQREFDSVNEKIAELADWEHYIATPRKQQLLTEIKAIVETPLDNPNEQAEKVKHYRKTWNSLGHADDDAEKGLNYEFNQLCETAFAPCRLYFAEQEKLREQHLVSRQSLLTQAKKLSESLVTSQANNQEAVVDFKLFDNELNKLIKLWQNSGQVDRNIFRAINTEFNEALQPVKSSIRKFHNDNKQLKLSFIKNAEKLLLEEDVYLAVTQVKLLQSQWRDTGYAGSKVENKLWQNFRKINDEIFSKREQQNAVAKNASSIRLAEFELAFETLEKEFEHADNLPALQEFDQALQSLKQSVKQQKPKITNLENLIDQKEKLCTDKIAKLKVTLEKQQWTNIFNVIEESLVSGISFTSHEIFSELTTFWQKKLQELDNKDKPVSRDELTLELEILSGVPSPKALQQKRMTVQVNLMQEQMSSGNTIDLPAKFNQWLMLGKLEQADVSLLQRIKAIFVN